MSGKGPHIHVVVTVESWACETDLEGEGAERHEVGYASATWVPPDAPEMDAPWPPKLPQQAADSAGAVVIGILTEGMRPMIQMGAAMDSNERTMEFVRAIAERRSVRAFFDAKPPLN